MSMEIEVKAYAENLVKIKEMLLGMGAWVLWEGEQVDTYFNHPARDFAATDEALRVREVKSRTAVTYKGPKLDTQSKTREEIEVQITDGSALKEMLEKLGFTEAGVVRKHRIKLALDECEFCLDSVENLGEFVEIEVVLPSDSSSSSIDSAKEKVFKLLERLGLTQRERRSYLELLYYDG